MKAPLIHVASMVFNEPLAILPEKLEAILHAIGPRLLTDETALMNLYRHMPPESVAVSSNIGSSLPLNTGGGIISTGGVITSIGSTSQVVIDGVPVKAWDDDDDEEMESASDSKPYRLTQEGIAVIPIRGTLMKRHSWMSAISGCSSYAGIQKAASAALADPMVRGVLFDVDSPGGTTHGCFELADALYGMRGEKPVWAIANDLAASAAYALASSADRVLLTRTAGVGSIGVFALHMDQSGADEKYGVKFTYVYAGQKKVDGNPHEALSKSARSDVQAEVDREYEMFVAIVARNRGFAGANAGKIQATEAGIFFAENATPLLADEVATFDEALEALTAKVSGSKAKTETAAKGEPIMAQTEDEKRAQAAAGATQATQAKACPECDGTGETENGGECSNCDGTGEVPDDKEGKKGKKAEAKKARKQDDQDSDDEPQGRRVPVTELPVASAPAKQIANLCILAGAPELAADYFVKGYTVDQVIDKLNARRVKASAQGNVSSFVSGESSQSTGRASVDQAIEQARAVAANSGGKLTMSKAMEQILRTNPEIYSGYLEERGAVAAQVAFTGGGKALTDYVLNHQRRYMVSLGLSPVVDDVPGHRSM